MAMDDIDNFKINFVGIGAIKAASSWIYECLQEHPEICLAPKDQRRIAFFFNENFSESKLKDYKYFFAGIKKKQLKGDFHAGYLTSPEVIDRLKEHNPDIKIIVCLRNPVQRAYSEYRFLKFSENASWNSFEQALSEKKRIIEHGFYHKYLSNYFKNFPRENILVMIYDDIKDNPTMFIQKIYKFLEVDSSFIAPSIKMRVNLTSFKNTRIGKLIHKSIIKPLLKNTKWAWKFKKSIFLKKLVYRFSELYSKKTIAKSEVDAQTCKRLKLLYKRDILNLETLINRDLSFWR